MTLRLAWTPAEIAAEMMSTMKLLAIVLAAARASTAHLWGVAHPSTHVFEDDSPLSAAPRQHVAGGRGGHEAAQIVVRPGASPADPLLAADVRVVFAALSGPGGATIAASNWEFRRVGRVYCPQPLQNAPTKGPLYIQERGPTWYADPLVPAQTVTLMSGVTSALFVSLAIPLDATPGNYSGSIVLASSDVSRLLVVPVQLRVWDVDIQHEARRWQQNFGFDWGVGGSTRYGTSIDGGARGIDATALRDFNQGLCERYAARQPSVWHWQDTTNDTAHTEMLLSARCGGGLEWVQAATVPTTNSTDAAMIKGILDALEPRIAALRALGVSNRSYIYGFDESGPDHAPAIAAMYGAVKVRWQEVMTLAVVS